MEYRILPEEVRESLSQEDIRDFTQTSLRTGQASVMGAAIEKHIVGRNGVQKVVELQTFAIPSDDGFQLGSICHDMSERESAAAALRESEARYRILAEMSSDSFTILRVDEDGAMHTVWRTTEALTRLTGYSPEELAPDGYRMQGIVVPEDRGKAVFDHTPERGSLHQEFRIQRKDGQIRWLRQRYRFEHDDAGRPTMLYLAAEDITEQKRVEQEALAFHLEKEQVRLLTQFVQNASHEFRTPLSVLNLDLHYFHRVLANQDQQSRLARMDTQVKTISGLVDALLTLSTLDSEVGLELAPVDLNLLLPDLAAQSQFEAHEADVTLSLDLSPNLPQILGDPRYLATAIHNLLGNAVRYTPQGGRITLSAEDTGDTVRVVVEDTGMGIAPEILPRIFERFYRVDEAHSTQGFGLGLSIAQKVAERHSGRIHVESEIGKGSVFVLELPVMADE
ncbi:MAG: PAS domain S-box protein [Caldilineaceae bacterium]|nr:PAS domain S-box protein [Caldilineaceae bacterium]